MNAAPRRAARAGLALAAAALPPTAAAHGMLGPAQHAGPHWLGALPALLVLGVALLGVVLLLIPLPRRGERPDRPDRSDRGGAAPASDPPSSEPTERTSP